MADSYDLEELLREFSSHMDETEAVEKSFSASADQTESAPSPPAFQAQSPEEFSPEDEYPEYEQDHGYEEFREDFSGDYDDEPEPERLAKPKAKSRTGKSKNILHDVLLSFAGLIFLGVSLLAIAWVGLNVHPDAGTASTASGSGKLNLMSGLDAYMNNAASDALSDLTYIRKIYTIDENATVAPVPNPDGFGTTDDPAVIQKLIDDAWELLAGQDTIWSPDVDFVPGEPMRYYYDETILVIQWKEYIDGRCCTMAEVKLAHGSQLRRKIADDTYGSSVRLYASEMANAANSVIAINGDFYTFRNLGITVYQRQLYRSDLDSVDTCFFDTTGNMIFSKAGQFADEASVKQFIEDNDILFSVAFGPVLVDNGELIHCDSYPIGEINTQYSRSCIAQKGELHYLLMTINHTPDTRPRATINELGTYIHSKGVDKAYTLDGGQTAEIVMMGGPVNYVDYNNERLVSDIIYFATALPNSSQEVSQ